MLETRGVLNIMDAHNANVKEYGEKKANRMQLHAFLFFVLFWVIVIGSVVLLR